MLVSRLLFALEMPFPFPVTRFTLDAMTLLLWWAKMVPLLLLALAMVAAARWAIHRRSWPLAGSTIILLVVVLLSMNELGWSPRGYYLRRMGPNLRVGEEVYAAYQRYYAEQGAYPPSTAMLALPDLDRFDVIVGERTHPDTCDGMGEGCTGLQVRTNDELAVDVMDGLIRCTLSGVQLTAIQTETEQTAGWRCRDQR